MADDSANLAAGTEALPPHEVFERIGDDASGRCACYRARDTARGAVVTLQVIHPSCFDTPDAAAAFLGEARAFARLRLPYLLPVHAAGAHDGRYAFTTTFPSRGGLYDRRSRFTDPRAAVDLLRKLAHGVAAAHAHGILHGNLRLNAVLFDEDEQPLIPVFDLVDGTFPRSGREEGAAAGVPAYMAPERFSAPRASVEAAADVWALGIILYELLTGRRPFEGTIPEIAFGVLHNAPPPPRRLRRDIDPSLEAVVLRCLQKRPEDRYPSARALAEDLERWLRAEPTAARPETLTQRILRGLSASFRGKSP